uniref:Uncharacterized protein n=1 Tax=Anguilla anguilla TaxID=7936 RepID=A0A0E9V6E5_ANGAN
MSVVIGFSLFSFGASIPPITLSQCSQPAVQSFFELCKTRNVIK